MFLLKLTKLRFPIGYKHLFTQLQKCHSVFGVKDLIQPEKTDNFTITHVTKEQHELALDILKEYYLPEHVFVRQRNMDIFYDQALDEYLIGLFKQGNSLLAKSVDGSVAGLCVNFACCPIDSKNLRHYAFYRQDPNIKDFLYFTAKMQETPNLWEAYRQSKIFEIKMLTVIPEYRRQGLAVLLTERSIDLAYDLNYNVVRLNCINPHDYKIAERCMLHCIAKFPLHSIRGPNASFIKKTSDYNGLARVYTGARVPLNMDLLGDKNKVPEQEIELLLD